MSQLYVDNIRNRTGGAVSFSQGIVAAGGTVSGNLSIGGTLTYEDVTNVSVTGIITANNGINVADGGINVTQGGVTIVGGGMTVTGVVTATSFTGDGSGLTGVESWNQMDTWLYGGG